jgi:hypothetical protein
MIGGIKKARRCKGSGSVLYLPVQWDVTEENRTRCTVFQKHAAEMFLKVAELEKMSC